jgi:hypothetical protein
MSLVSWPFFELFNHRGRADFQHTGRIPDATDINRHIRNLLLHSRPISPVGILLKVGTASTVDIPTFVSLFGLR